MTVAGAVKTTGEATIVVTTMGVVVTRVIVAVTATVVVGIGKEMGRVVTKG